ncbi:MAG: hypothetical protein CVU17_08175 [Betaproteobacteria bacterium HGW-Betaproteobacteria-11]|nr:MAG: hypothetical protein CVU17_08175 [Betaproteobacteria bacterium HGW-Betaproteobacteria-11]
MKHSKTLSLAVGAAFTALAFTPAAFAAGNPFAMQKLDSGYQLAGNDATKTDGKCGASMGEKKKEGKCGEGKCGADMKKKQAMHDGKCGASMDEKKKEGKCGEGKCGAGKKAVAPQAEEKK